MDKIVIIVESLNTFYTRGINRHLISLAKNENGINLHDATNGSVLKVTTIQTTIKSTENY